ncbi:MAG: alpha/beta fold hydrolase [Phycisphaeraceae bacterium]|nr:alpha/beta fold hydrolase [Phycisphaeraceae bacterium]MCW5754963.1 alpha/beta fold hydrolase [Phycisphaeraceae bacterium]
MGLVLLLLAGLVCAWVLGIVLTLGMLIRPPRRTYATAVARGRPGDPGERSPALAFESFTFSSRGRRLCAWDIRCRNPGGPVVILSHGWGDSRIGAIARLDPLLPHASRIIAWDLPGHGDSPGCCRLGVHEPLDLITLIEIIRPSDTPSTSVDIVLWGWSLGAGVSIVAAAARAEGILGVIAESPYRDVKTPARNVLRIYRLPHFGLLGPALALVGGFLGAGARWRRAIPPADVPFDRVSHAAYVRCPVLVLHGERDEISPLDDGRQIAESCRGQLVSISGGRHNTLWTDPQTRQSCAISVEEFMRTLAGTIDRHGRGG